MKLSRYEQETIIHFNEEELTASIYTHNKKLRQKLERMARQHPDKVSLERQGPNGAAAYTLPKRCVSVREPYSDGRRAADSQRAKEAKIRPPNRSVCSKT